MPILFQHVTFAHEGASAPLLEDVTLHLPDGWTGVVGANGAGKTTVLRLAAGDLQPVTGTIRRPEQIVFCPQRTDHAPALLPGLIAATQAEICALRGKLQIGADWAERWATLSHGERKRAQIAVALAQRPDALLVDEPTNHIDLAARELLADALAAFRGTGLLVSHDRELLDRLCAQCLFLEPPLAALRPGGYTVATAVARRDEASAQQQRRKLKRRLERLTGESQRRRADAARADRMRSKRNLARGDSDGRAKIDSARVSGKDGQAGRIANQLSGRLAQAQESLASMPVRKRYAMNFWLEGSISPRPRLFSLPPGEIALGSARRLILPRLTMQRRDRVAITGANGLGKSTLVAHILRGLDLPVEHLIHVPQEIDLARTRAIMADVQRLSPAELGQVMTVVSGLGSRPERLLQNLEASPGELRKVLLALGVVRRPYLIIMDEPTNHLDIPAIECMENALRECPCGLLLVSHDLHFLAHVTAARWHLQEADGTVTLDANARFARR